GGPARNGGGGGGGVCIVRGFGWGGQKAGDLRAKMGGGGGGGAGGRHPPHPATPARGGGVRRGAPMGSTGEIVGGREGGGWSGAP
ncbi:hypothetical protein CYD66_29070, partial [Klebsiella pneumoniae]